jgi:hypothetical protein
MDDKTMDIYKEAKAQYVQGRWTNWPENSNQDLVFEWLMKFQKTVLTKLRHKYYILVHKVLGGLEADRMPDIFLTSASALPNSEHSWLNVLIIGEHKSNPSEDRSMKTLVQLVGYAQEVFGS